MKNRTNKNIEFAGGHPGDQIFRTFEFAGRECTLFSLDF